MFLHSGFFDGGENHMKKFWVLVGIGILCANNATASGPCPEGCFCQTSDGKIPDKLRNNHSYLCGRPAHTIKNTAYCDTFAGGITVAYNSDSNCQADYYIDEFSEFYEGDFGAYGFKNGEFIYFHRSTGSYITDNSVQALNILICPYTHPHSASGSKALNECFKYDANGNKIYYSTGQTIHCNAGTYLPAGATSCVACNTSQNQICSGGNFDRSNTVQGLRVNCNPGEYLPANATQCSTCNNNNYSCSGGIYDFNANIDQGLNIQHDGYINATNSNGGLHNYTACQPGQYMPATSNTCTACTGDYACPGGIFYTDATYNRDRGRILCSYGTANSTHTSCISQSSDPSFAKGKRLQITQTDAMNAIQSVDKINNTASSTQQNTQPQTNQLQQNTTQTFNIKKEEIKSDSESAKKIDFGSLPSLFSNDRAAVPVNRTISRSATSKKIKTTSVSRSANTPQRSINNGKKMRPTSSRGVATNR